MTKKFPAGTRVEGGVGEDHDTGTVMQAPAHAQNHPMASGPNVWVSWDSGVATWSPVEDLSEIDE